MGGDVKVESSSCMMRCKRWCSLDSGGNLSLGPHHETLHARMRISIEEGMPTVCKEYDAYLVGRGTKELKGVLIVFGITE